MILRTSKLSSVARRPFVGAGLLAGLTACGPDKPVSSGGGETVDDTGDAGTTSVDVTVFELTLRVVLPLNQGNLFDEVARLDIVITQDGNEVGRYSLEDIARGELGRGGDDLPALSNAAIALEGFAADGEMVAYGKANEVSIADGEESEITIFVSRINDVGWLNGLEAGAFGAGMVADGSGGVLMFGGTPAYRSRSDVVGGAYSTIQRLDLTQAGDQLAFETVGTMPYFATALDEHGRAGHTATRLGGTHDYADYILVAGGSTDFWDQTQTTDHAFLWDPATATVVDVPVTLATPMSRHVAVADSAGNVVLSGGSTQTDANNRYTTLRALTFFRGNTLEAESLTTGSEERRWVHHAGARFGDRGVLLCGGLDFGSDGLDDEVLDVCAVISTTGVYTSQSESGITLPRPLLHHAMVGLADGSVLLTGGTGYESGVYEVTNAAWVLSPDGSTWTEVGPMHLQRAHHRMTLLPDGRVLVVGGVSSMEDHWWDAETAVACAEVFNPELGDFVEVGTCTPEAVDGDLPEAVAIPALATDPVSGAAVVVGGLNRSNEGATGVSVYRASLQ